MSTYISKSAWTNGKVIEGQIFWYIYTVFNWCLIEKWLKKQEI